MIPLSVSDKIAISIYLLKLKIEEFSISKQKSIKKYIVHVLLVFPFIDINKGL